MTHQAMIAFSAGEVVQPVRQMVQVPGRDGIIAAMPAVGDAMAVKFLPSISPTPAQKPPPIKR